MVDCAVFLFWWALICWGLIMILWTKLTFHWLLSHKKQIVSLCDECLTHLYLLLWKCDLNPLHLFLLVRIDDNQVIANTCTSQVWPVEWKGAHVLENSLLYLVILFKKYMFSDHDVLKIAPVHLVLFFFSMSIDMFEFDLCLEDLEFVVSHHKEFDVLSVWLLIYRVLLWLKVHHVDYSWLHWAIELHQLVRWVWVLELNVFAVPAAADKIETTSWVISY